jgi:predicted CoA-binding protein
MKLTIVLGASANPARYSFRAVERLTEYGYQVIAIGRREGSIGEIPIMTGMPEIENVHTISLYLSSDNQVQYYDFILRLCPRRIIFNPGTENRQLAEICREQGIEVVENCTLVMLSLHEF